MITPSDLARAAAVAREVHFRARNRATVAPHHLDHHRCVGQDPHPLRPGSRTRLASELACQSTCGAAYQRQGHRCAGAARHGSYGASCEPRRPRAEIWLAATCLSTRRSADASRTSNLRTDASGALIAIAAAPGGCQRRVPTRAGRHVCDGRPACNVSWYKKRDHPTRVNGVTK